MPVVPWDDFRKTYNKINKTNHKTVVNWITVSL
jgi:hypothetical protein